MKRSLDSNGEDHESVKKAKTSLESDNQVTEGFQPGAIRRVRMIDFVTYSDMEFTLGSALNMIIGPNGTGKSTFVCAICLGFNGSPNLLGRAKDLKEFVKNGREKAKVEIEVQGMPGRANLVVRREFDINNKNTWFINNKHATAKKVDEVIQRYNIQVDNLCQFLPQDKVASFAQSTPQDLLTSTERAIGNADLYETHVKLKELGKQLMMAEHEGGGDDEKLEELKTEHARQAEDMKTLENMEAQKERLEAVSNAIPIVLHQKLQADLASCRERYEAAKQRKEELMGQNGPFIELAGNARQQMEDIPAKSRQAREQRGKISLQVQTADQEAQQFAEDFEKIQHDLEQIDKQVETYENKLNMARQEHDNAEREHEKVVQRAENSEETAKKLKEEVEEGKSRRDEIRKEEVKVEDELTPHSQERYLHMNILQTKNNKLKELESDVDRKLKKLGRFGPTTAQHTAKAIQYIREMKENGQFEKEVHEPPVLTLKIVNQSQTFLRQLDNALSVRDWLTISCESSRDYDKISQHLQSRQNQLVTIKDISRHGGEEGRKTPVSKEEIKRQGFDMGFLIDNLDGPPEVLSMLCVSAFVHTIPCCSRRLDTNQRKDIEEWIESMDPNGRLKIQRYMDVQSLYSLKRSNYGNKKVTSSLSQLKREGDIARLGNENDIDEDELQELRTDIDREQLVVKEYNDLVLPLKEKGEELKRQRIEVQREIDAKQSELKQVRNIQMMIQTKYDKKENARQKLAKVENERPDFDAKREQLEAKLDECAERLSPEHIENLLAPWKQVVDLRFEQMNLVLDENMYAIEHETYKKLSKYGLEDVEQEMNTIKLEGKSLRQQVGQAAKDVDALSEQEREQSQAIITELGNDVYEMKELAERIGLSIREMEEDMPNAAQMRREFERRGEEIQTLQDRVDNHQQKLQELRTSIEQLKLQWEPELERLLSRVNDQFSRAFADIGCSGKVLLEKHPTDFGLWAVKIMVSFREGTEMQPLTGQRQSGGERAVSTVLYLMSLQELAKSPFRVVDEINQGMDPVNERMVHNRMVNVACDQTTSQYFLITPKLLPNLLYDPRMKVSCIYSGTSVDRKPERDGTVTCQSTLQAILNRA